METPALSPAAETPGVVPLLPPFLLSPLAFFWLWVLPLGVLLVLNVQGFWLIEGNCDAAQRSHALQFGLAGALNFFAGLLVFGATRWLGSTSAQTRTVHFLWGLPAVVAQVGYLWLAVYWADEILPRSVTTWIYPTDRYLFNQFAFAMLPLFLGILRLACARPVTGVGKVIALNVGLVFAAPLVLYLFFQFLGALHVGGEMPFVIVAVCVILLGIVMFFGLVRCLLFGLAEIRKHHAAAERGAIVLFALALPIAGLLLNRSIPFPVDFQAWEVYALVVANTAILLLASWRHAAWPRASFCLLCATLPFSLYFFIVFLPYTPLSILAVIVIGTGFLVLTPTFLFVLHLYLLNAAWRGVAAGRARLQLLALGLGCGLLLPGWFVLRSLADKAALNAALDYVYAPAVNRGDSTYAANRLNLRRALHSHRAYKNGIYYPLLSDFYSWAVFDNLVLPDDKLDRLETTFFGAPGSRDNADPVRNKFGARGERSVRDRARMPRAANLAHTVAVTGLKLGVNPAGEGVSTVTFRLTLANTGSMAAEYRQALRLPPGFFVNGFRLHIDGIAAPGRIVEKKTALWVYTMIRDSERRDPGLLFYNTPDELELRVFPVAAEKPSVVELDFLVPAALTAEMLPMNATDPAEILAELGHRIHSQITSTQHDRFVAGGLDALNLPPVEREPYLHVIIDRSAENGFDGDLSAALRTLQQKFPAARRARISLANYDVTDLVAPLTPLSELAGNITLARDLGHVLPLAGGFGLDLALAHALRRHRDLELDAPAPAIPPQPIFVILSRAAKLRDPELKLAAAWADLVPGLEIQELDATGTLRVQHVGAGDAPLLRMGGSLRPLVAGHGVRFETEVGDAPLEFWSPAKSEWQSVAGVERAEPGLWPQAVALQLQQQDYSRSPGNAPVELSGLVKASRASGVLLPCASYIVVENEAQWRIMELSERQKLAQNSALAFKETPAPPALWLVLGFALWLALHHRESIRKTVAAVCDRRVLAGRRS